MNTVFFAVLIVLVAFSTKSKAQSCSAQCIRVPSINLQGREDLKDVYLDPKTVISIFAEPIAANNGHVTGGMTYSNGKITVPEAGVYFIYSTLRLHAYATRYYIKINTRKGVMAVPVGSGSTSATVSYLLNEGDQIFLEAVDKLRIYVGREHNVFGAFKVQ